MATFRIVRKSSGAEMGDYQAADQYAALLAMMADASSDETPDGGPDGWQDFFDVTVLDGRIYSGDDVPAWVIGERVYLAESAESAAAMHAKEVPAVERRPVPYRILAHRYRKVSTPRGREAIFVVPDTDSHATWRDSAWIGRRGVPVALCLGDGKWGWLGFVGGKVPRPLAQIFSALDSCGLADMTPDAFDFVTWDPGHPAYFDPFAA